MSHSSFDAVEVGDGIPALEIEPITRATLALYAGASGDHNPIHIDTDFARNAGEEDVFAHGMLVMAYLGRALTEWVPQSALREFDVRFVSVTHVGDRLSCMGEITEKFEQDGEKRVRLRLVVTDELNDAKLTGTAVVCIP